MIDLNYERQLETVEDVAKLEFYPLALVCKHVCHVTGMKVRKFYYHFEKGYFPRGNVLIEGEKEPWYDGAQVAKILELCRVRRWTKTATDNDR